MLSDGVQQKVVSSALSATMYSPSITAAADGCLPALSDLIPENSTLEAVVKPCGVVVVTRILPRNGPSPSLVRHGATRSISTPVNKSDAANFNTTSSGASEICRLTCATKGAGSLRPVESGVTDSDTAQNRSTSARISSSISVDFSRGCVASIRALFCSSSESCFTTGMSA